MQNFKNHSRYSPLHHFILTPITLTALIWSIVNFIQNNEERSENAFLMLLAVGLFIVTLISRTYATKNQDRLIRIEMRLRYFEMTGKSFSEKENQLKLSQVIALRFASNEELLMLIDKVIAEKLSSKAIKMFIRNWQADHNRV